MSDWMSGPHRAQRPVDLEVASDPEPVELTDPLDVIAWLRALPDGTVLLDRRGRAWQLHISPARGRIFVRAGSTSPYSPERTADMAIVAAYAPFRVLWRPGGAT